MKRAFVGLVVAAIWACTSSAQTFSWAGYQQDNYKTYEIKLNAINVVTQVNITSATLANGCNSNLVYGYTPNSGPALQVGEMVQSTVLYYPAASSTSTIVALGDSTYTVSATGCTSIATAPTNSTGMAGISFSPTLYQVFSGGAFNGASDPWGDWGSTAVCDPARSSASFTLVQPDGSISQENAAPNTVTCSNAYNFSTHQLTTTGSFSGVLSTGQAYTSTFVIVSYISFGSGRDPRGGVFAQSASWSVVGQ